MDGAITHWKDNPMVYLPVHTQDRCKKAVKDVTGQKKGNSNVERQLLNLYSIRVGTTSNMDESEPDSTIDGADWKQQDISLYSRPIHGHISALQGRFSDPEGHVL